MQSVDFCRTKIIEILRDDFNETPETAELSHIYSAAATVVRRLLAQRSANQKYRGDKRIYYLSMEFLMGRSLRNDLYNLGIKDAFEAALASLGVSPDKIYEQEPDAGLGNGGLGRLAACFLDGLATIGKPAMGYSICYEYGIFRQQLCDGWQTEKPDDWLPGGKVWLSEQAEKSVEVNFGGEIEESWHDGFHHVVMKNCETVKAVPYDILIPGYGAENVSKLRLWRAESPLPDMDLFNRGLYPEAFRKAAMARAISSILYPNDSHPEGKLLRLKQQYFLCCATISDIVRRHLSKFGALETLPEKSAIHINDTHPALAIPELMRILLDECGFTWENAEELCLRLFSYTNHTVLPEALECWNVPMFSALLPRIFTIIKELDRREREYLSRRGFSSDEIERMAIISGNRIHMANLCVYCCHSINGVSEHHVRVMETSVFSTLYKAFPERFCGITNGIAARRWLCCANPELTAFIKKYAVPDFEHDYKKMSMLKKHTDDYSALSELSSVKRLRKEIFAAQNFDVCGKLLDPSSIFDVQAKRLHEYKRQHLNAMRIIALMNRLDADPNTDIYPRTFIFGAKAAPGYYIAKRIIKLIWCIGKELSENPNYNSRLRLCFLENYSVTASELLMPAADISEQISLAGTEASGTGNMKLMIGGAVTLGTLDGANIEIMNAVGEENFLRFGMDIDDVRALKARGYRPFEFVDSDGELKGVLDRMRHGIAGEDFSDLANMIAGDDRYMAAADFRSYMDIQDKADKIYRNDEQWFRMSLMNIAAAPDFFVDRTVENYCEKIWGM